MKCKIIFDDWRQVGVCESIYNTELGVELSMGELHGGTTFDAILEIPIAFGEDIECEIREAMKDHKAYPVFAIIVED